MDDLSNTVIYQCKSRKSFFSLPTQVARSHWLKKLISCLFFFLLLSCKIGKDPSALENLIGVWETTEPRYEGCSFEVQNDFLMFTNAQNEVDINYIDGIEKVAEKDTAYHIYYKGDNDQKYTLSLLFFKSPDGDVIKFENQPEIEWTRRSPDTPFLD